MYWKNYMKIIVTKRNQERWTSKPKAGWSYLSGVLVEAEPVIINNQDNLKTHKILVNPKWGIMQVVASIVNWINYHNSSSRIYPSQTVATTVGQN